MEEKRTQAGQVMATLGRHIHFKRKPVFEKALRVWRPEAASREAARIQSAVLMSRQRQSLEPSIVFHALLGAALQASKQ
jgi:DNA polymerase-3 subunit delta